MFFYDVAFIECKLNNSGDEDHIKYNKYKFIQPKFLNNNEIDMVNKLINSSNS